MSLQLPNASAQYDSSNESQTRSALARADGQNLKRRQDIVGSRLILSAPNGSTYLIAVDNTGALSAQEITL